MQKRQYNRKSPVDKIKDVPTTSSQSAPKRKQKTQLSKETNKKVVEDEENGFKLNGGKKSGNEFVFTCLSVSKQWIFVEEKNETMFSG